MSSILRMPWRYLPIISFLLTATVFCSAKSDELSDILAKIRAGQYVGDASTLTKIKEKAGPAIEALAEDPDPEVRRRAVECLGDMDYNVDTNIFKQFSFPKMGNFDRMVYFQMLYPRRTPVVRDFLLGIYKNAGQAMREAAMNCLTAYTGDKEIAGILIKDFNSSEGEEKAKLAIALAKLEAPGTNKLLSGMLNSKDAKMRGTALFALGILGGEESAKAAAGMLSDKEPGVRAMALRVIGRAKDLEFIPELEKCAREDKAEENRYLAATVTERIKRETLNPLDKRVEEIDIDDISNLDPDMNRSEYKTAADRISRLDREYWPQLMRKIDVKFSMLKLDGHDAVEAEGFTFLAMLRPLAAVDEESAIKALQSTLPDRSYDTRIRLMAMEYAEDEAVLKRIANNPLEPPVLKTAATDKMERLRVTRK